MNNLVRWIFLAASICCSVTGFAQEKFDVTGVWTGEIYNDSTQKYIPFELAISRKSGELYGYSYTVFMIDSIENIGVKEVTVSEKNGMFVIKDKKLIDDNYSDRPAKGVYTTLQLMHAQNDTADILEGNWFTNRTKQFYPLSGTVRVSKKRAIFQTRIVKRLSDLGLANRLSFVQPNHGQDNVSVTAKTASPGKEEEMITIVEPELVIELPKKDTTPNLAIQSGAIADILDAALAEKKTDTLFTAVNSQQQPSSEKQLEMPVSPASAKKAIEGQESMVVQKPVQQVQNAAGNTGAFGNNKQETRSEIDADKATETYRQVTGIQPALEQMQQQKPAIAPVAPPRAAPKMDLSKRKIETISSMNIVSDSIVLSLFDNGTIDGDTVSVLLNGKVIMSRVGLLATAYNHTVHLTPEMGDSIKLILYAENLGSIPPNTGLLVVRDGGKNHEIRFSGDLKNNSAIILRRNKKE